MGTPAVLIRKSTGEIIKHADYPRLDMAPVEGLDPDLEWLVKVTPYAAPEYDSRIYILQQNESVTQEQHPVWTWLNQCQITYQTVKRSATEIETSIMNAENEANSQVFPYMKQLKLMALAIGVLFRNVEGMTLNAKETAIKQKMLALAVNVWKNHDVMTAKVAEVAAGTEPNIDEGWEKTETV
jgi:hypothetical protein